MPNQFIFMTFKGFIFHCTLTPENWLILKRGHSALVGSRVTGFAPDNDSEYDQGNGKIHELRARIEGNVLKLDVHNYDIESKNNPKKNELLKKYGLEHYITLESGKDTEEQIKIH